MAAINANPFINQHGLPSETKPSNISKFVWKLAKDTSETSNLNFNVSQQTAGDVITDLITDHYNLTGSDNRSPSLATFKSFNHYRHWGSLWYKWLPLFRSKSTKH